MVLSQKSSTTRKTVIKKHKKASQLVGRRTPLKVQSRKVGSKLSSKKIPTPSVVRVLRTCAEDRTLVLVKPRSVGVDPRILADYEAAMRTTAQKGIVPGVASVVLRRGELVQAKAWGYADLEAKRPFRLNTICRVYCMTKTYVTVLFMTLVEEGKVQLEDPVSKFIPAFADVKVVDSSDSSQLKRPRRIMRMRHLLNHTSGLGYSSSFGSKTTDPAERSYAPLMNAVERGGVRDLADFINRLAKLPLRLSPGDQYMYGFSHEVVGRVCEIIMGQTLDVCLRSRIFEPLGMHDTGFSVPDDKLHRLAACYCKRETWEGLYRTTPAAPRNKHGLYRLDGERAEDSAWRKGRESKVLAGGGFIGRNQGGLVSTVADTSRFVRMLHRGGQGWNGHRVLKETSLAILEREQLDPAFANQDKQCFFGNLGGDSGQEFGWGGAACTYWSLCRKEENAVVWFTQHVDMPEWEEQKVVDAAKADVWGVLAKATKTKRKAASYK